MTLPANLASLFALAFIPMIVEARIAAANDRKLRAAGAIEPTGDVYRLMQLAYPGCFLIMLLEAWLRGSSPGGAAIVGGSIFLAAKALKYWAIATLGERWTFRVLVPPGSRRKAGGPYRLLRHPNYVGVVGELLGFALLTQAAIGGVMAMIGFGALLVARIRVEERALGIRSR
jgi:methyltransferase